MRTVPSVALFWRNSIWRCRTSPTDHPSSLWLADHDGRMPETRCGASPRGAPHLTSTRATAPRGSDAQAATPAHEHDVQAHEAPHEQLVAESLRTSCVAVPQVQMVQLQVLQTQDGVVSVFMANLGAGIVTRRSGVSGLRTRHLQVRRSS
jgi:hypothetical protein